MEMFRKPTVRFGSDSSLPQNDEQVLIGLSNYFIENTKILVFCVFCQSQEKMSRLFLNVSYKLAARHRIGSQPSVPHALTSLLTHTYKVITNVIEFIF